MDFPFLEKPKMTTLFDEALQPGALSYQALLEHMLERVIEADQPLFDSEELLCPLSERLPLISSHVWKEGGCHLSLYLLCEQKPHVSSFFYEMISRWLIPHRAPHVAHFLSSQITLQDVSFPLILCEIVILFSSEEERSYSLENLEIISEEIALGARSMLNARRILEMKGISSEEKISVVQARITQLLQRKPYLLTQDIFGLMHRFFISFSEDFKRASDGCHLCRLIYLSHIFCKQLEKERENEPFRHHIKVKIVKTQQLTPFGVKPMLGVLIGLHFVGENEIFEFKHIGQVIQGYVLDVEPQREKYLSLEENGIQIRYAEWECSENPSVFLKLKQLEKSLAEDFQLCIEKRVKKVFMPRNEEEILKNIVLLAGELQYVSDVPQVMIHFDHQSETHLVFTVIVARLLRTPMISIEEKMHTLFPELKIFTERKRIVGILKKKTPKEVSVLGWSLETSSFLREDHSVDVLKARQVIAQKLEKSLGEFRDFNGGMIAKNDKAFADFVLSLEPHYQRKTLLIKNFFHALFPIENRAVISSQSLNTFFEAFFAFSNQEEEELSVKYRSYGVSWILKRYPTAIDTQLIFEKLMEEARLSSGFNVFRLSLENGVYIGVFVEEANESLWPILEKGF